MTFTNTIKVDVGHPWKTAQVYVKQGDKDSRKIRAELMNGAASWTIPVGTVATFRAKKPDDTVVTQDATIGSPNIVEVVLDEQVGAVFGVVRGEIRLVNGGEILNTFLIAINVEAAAVTDGDIVSESVLDEYQTYVNEIIAVKGAPMVANLVADMTDPNRVYVYTGSEDGYIYGDWYFYDNGSWVVGGVYNSLALDTDETLTKLGMAADAGALAFLSNYLTYTNYDGDWNQGSISSGTGANASSSTRIRSDYFRCTSDGGVLIAVPAGMKCCAYQYTGSSSSTFVPGAVVPAWAIGNVVCFPKVGNYMRVVLAFSDDSAIVPADAAGVTISHRAYSGLASLHYVGHILTSADDLDDLQAPVYGVWNSGNRPLNAPEATGGSIVCLFRQGGSTGAQICVTQAAEMYFRWKTSSSWSAWKHVQIV